MEAIQHVQKYEGLCFGGALSEKWVTVIIDGDDITIDVENDRYYLCIADDGREYWSTEKRPSSVNITEADQRLFDEYIAASHAREQADWLSPAWLEATRACEALHAEFCARHPEQIRQNLAYFREQKDAYEAGYGVS